MLCVIKDTLEELVKDSLENSTVENNETNEEKVIFLLLKDGKLSAKRLATEIGISERQVERIVKDLKASGKIQRIGANKGGYWKVD